MTISTFQMVGFLAVAMTYLPLGLAQSVGLSITYTTTTYTTTTVYKTVALPGASITKAETTGLPPGTGTGKIFTSDLIYSSANGIETVNIGIDPTCTSAGIIFDCQATPNDAHSVNVTNVSEAVTATMTYGATVTSASMMSSAVSLSNAVEVATTSTSTSTAAASTTVTAIHYTLPSKTVSPASASYTNQFAALLASDGNGGGKATVVTRLVVAIVFLALGHALVMAFF